MLKEIFLLFNPGREVSFTFLKGCLNIDSDSLLAALNGLEEMGLIKLQNGSFVCTCLEDCNRNKCSSVRVNNACWTLTLKGVELRNFRAYDSIMDTLLQNP
jgi:hypothetical protein